MDAQQTLMVHVRLFTSAPMTGRLLITALRMTDADAPVSRLNHHIAGTAISNGSHGLRWLPGMILKRESRMEKISPRWRPEIAMTCITPVRAYAWPSSGDKSFR
jgi:hypothetical protein